MSRLRLIVGGLLASSTLITGCVPNPGEEGGMINQKWRMPSDPANITVIYKHSGEGKGSENVKVISGKAEWDGWTEAAVELPRSMQSVIYSSSKHEGNPFPDALEVVAKGGVRGLQNTNIVYQIKDFGKFALRYKDKAQLSKWEELFLKPATRACATTIYRNLSPFEIQTISGKDPSGKETYNVSKMLLDCLNESKLNESIEFVSVDVVNPADFGDEINAEIKRVGLLQAKANTAEEELKLLEKTSAVAKLKLERFKLEQPLLEYQLKEKMVADGKGNPFQPSIGTSVK
jgi:hypothetical protein